MGEACARALVTLGAEVHGADIRPSPVNMASFTPVDLKDWDSIDRAVSGIGGEIDVLFNCAGLPQTFPPAAVLDTFTAPTGRRSAAEEQANPMVLLNSDAASFISGVCLAVDGGFHGGVTIGAIDMQGLLARAMAPAA